MAATGSGRGSGAWLRMRKGGDISRELPGQVLTIPFRRDDGEVFDRRAPIDVRRKRALVHLQNVGMARRLRRRVRFPQYLVQLLTRSDAGKHNRNVLGRGKEDHVAQ